MHPDVVFPARPGASEAGEVDRRILVNKRQRYELGESTALVLYSSEPTEWETQCGGASTWPYIIVDELCRPMECAVLTMSSHESDGSLPLVSTHRTSSSRISAAVPVLSQGLCYDTQ